jgi:hypothetical protein
MEPQAKIRAALKFPVLALAGPGVRAEDFKIRWAFKSGGISGRLNWRC